MSIENRKVKNILITGKDSYVGSSVESWLLRNPDLYKVTTLDMRSENWENEDFSKYDVIFHVAGIAHADVGKVSDDIKNLYYSVNTELAVNVAEKAKESGVKQFIFMSSMIVYSGCSDDIINISTIPQPLNFYGDSKWQADQRINSLRNEKFNVAVLRPPMIYGKGSKGNYPKLAKLARKLFVFPKFNNKRSMLYIGNLCEFVKLVIDNEDSGVFFPQNREYVNTSELVKSIAFNRKHKVFLISGFSWVIKFFMLFKGRFGQLCKKVFGNQIYDLEMSKYKSDYQIFNFFDSIALTEDYKI